MVPWSMKGENCGWLYSWFAHLESRQLRAGGIGVAPGGPGEASAVRSIRGPGGFLMGRTGS